MSKPKHNLFKLKNDVGLACAEDMTCIFIKLVFLDAPYKAEAICIDLNSFLSLKCTVIKWPVFTR